MHDRPIGEVFRALAGQNVSVRYERKEGIRPWCSARTACPAALCPSPWRRAASIFPACSWPRPWPRPCLLGVIGSKVVSCLCCPDPPGHGGLRVPAEIALLTNGAWIPAAHGRPVSAEPGKSASRFGREPTARVPTPWRATGATPPTSWPPGPWGPTRCALRCCGRTRSRPTGPSWASWPHGRPGVLGRRRGARGPAEGGAARSGSGHGPVPGPGAHRGRGRVHGPGATTSATWPIFASRSPTAWPPWPRKSPARGGGAELLSDGIRVTPGALASGREVSFLTYGDHRMAMSLSLYALGGIRSVLDIPGCVAKSFPGFFGQWEPVVAAAREVGRD